MRHLLAVRDSALEAFLPLFTSPSVGAAMRGFEDEARNPDGVIAKHPGHYSLYEFGKWDDISGAFDLLPVPRLLVIASDFSAV